MNGLKNVFLSEKITQRLLRWKTDASKLAIIKENKGEETLSIFDVSHLSEDY